MMADESYVIHGERIVDGDASTLTALTLFNSGSTTVRTLGATEFLSITDIIISSETAGDVVLVADSAAAGRYIVSAGVAATSVINLHFVIPYCCPRGVVPKFSGPAGQAGSKTSCTIQGFIRES